MMIKATEINFSLREALNKKGHNLTEETNCLGHHGKYDRILMNPPFEKLQDIDHVRHCFDQLKEGGVLVAVMATVRYSGW